MAAAREEHERRNWEPATSFENIPPELLLEVAGYLDAVDRQALRLACRRLYYTLPRERLIDWATKSNRLSFACLLDRDGILESTAICSHCAALHPRPCFSAEELARGPADRRCEGSKRVFYFRPGFSLSAKQMRNKLEEVVFDLRPADCFDDWSCAADRAPALRRDSERADVDVVRDGYILHTIKLMECAPKHVPTRQAVEEYLRRFDVPICPHMSLGDPAVMEQYFLDPVQKRGESVLSSSAPGVRGGSCAVRACGTAFGFSLSGWKRSGRNHFLVVHIIREVGNPEDPNDSTWWAQTLPPQELDGLDERWAKSDAFRQSQLQRGVVFGVPVNWTWWLP